MSKPPSQTPPSRPRKGRVFLISLLLSLAAGLLLGCGLYMARRYMTKGSAADSFMLADQGYTNVIEFGGIKDWHGETVAS